MNQQNLFDRPAALRPVVAEAAPAATPVVGQRVRVAILNRETYALGCAESLDDKAGVVEERYDVDHYKVPYREPRCLVRFDEPAAIWWTNQLPVNAFWFDAGELKSL